MIKMLNFPDLFAYINPLHVKFFRGIKNIFTVNSLIQDATLL